VENAKESGPVGAIRVRVEVLVRDTVGRLLVMVPHTTLCGKIAVAKTRFLNARKSSEFTSKILDDRETFCEG